MIISINSFKLYIATLLVVLTSFSQYTFAQEQDFTLYHMQSVQQSMYLNPSFIPTNNINIGLPVISSINLSLNNTGFRYNDLIKRRPDDSLAIDMNNLVRKLQNKNLLSLAASVDLLSFGFRVKQNYFSFSIREKYRSTFLYPKGLIKLVWEGNGSNAFLGKRANMDGLGLDLIHYRETALGYAREINDKLTIGAKFKLLYGMENIHTKKSKLGLSTDATTFDLTLDGSALIQSSGINELDNGQVNIGNHLSGLNNRGFGVDFGAQYQLNDKINISASVLDLGFISWKNDIRTASKDNINFTFKGIGLYDIITTPTDTTTQNVINALNDSISNVFTFNQDSTPYSTGINSRILIGASYKITNNQSFGFHTQIQSLNGSLRQNLVLSYSAKAGRWLDFTTSYSIYNFRYHNIGLGLACNLDFWQMYVTLDNALAPFFPEKMRNAQIHVGVNFIFGRKPADKDGDGIKDTKDKCPDVAGIKQLEGCPDSDLDGIKDSEDECPTVYGLAKFGGCPDTDGDGVGDLQDDCIDVPGLIAFKGCPDTDKDSIPDSKDDCPLLAGLKINNGCPDSDGDGVLDSKDECPNTKGIAMTHGCPLTRLSIMSPEGLILMTASLNEDGVFVFKNLPTDKKYLFKMNGEDVYLSDELLVVFENDGKQEIIKAKKKGDSFNYEYLPPVKSKLSLLIIDENGNILRTAFKNKDGKFVYENLPTNKQYLFKMEGSDDDSVLDNLQIIVKNPNGIYSMTLKKKGIGFNYDYLPDDKFALALIQFSDDGELVILNLADKEIVNKAFENLQFNYNSAVIRHNSIKNLDELANLLNQHTKWKLLLSGHTDNSGNEIANLALSKRRAEAVKKYLVGEGVNYQMVIVKYYGESQPLESNETEDGKQKNRRVEMKILE